MSAPRRARDLLGKLFPSLRDSESSEPERREPDVPPASEPTPTPEPSEFDSFLSDLGSEPLPAGGSNGALKDATIAELTARLADLRTLGDELARTERARLAAVERIAGLERELAERPEEAAPSATTVARLEKRIATLERGRARDAERLKSLRAKHEDRKRAAAERWHQIVDLRRQVKALKSGTDRDSRAA